jgi:hypothetical protein
MCVQKELQGPARDHAPIGLKPRLYFQSVKIGPAARKLRSDVIVPFKREKRSILAVIDVFPPRVLPSGTPDSAGVTPFLTSRVSCPARAKFYANGCSAVITKTSQARNH